MRTNTLPTFQGRLRRAQRRELLLPTVVQGLMAVSRHETCFSECKPFIRAHNHGAIQCGTIADKNGKCPSNCIPRGTPAPRAARTWPTWSCFRAKPSADEGIADFVRLMTVQRPLIAEALPSGDARQIAWAMRKSYYFEGSERRRKSASRTTPSRSSATRRATPRSSRRLKTRGSALTRHRRALRRSRITGIAR